MALVGADGKCQGAGALSEAPVRLWSAVAFRGRTGAGRREFGRATDRAMNSPFPLSFYLCFYVPGAKISRFFAFYSLYTAIVNLYAYELI